MKTESIWKKLSKPIFVLAPMDDVTDTVFRQIIASLAPPDIFFTEFTSVDGLQSSGRTAIVNKLRFNHAERPIIAQVWGMVPDNYFKSASEITKLGFAGIDINMGCPVPKVVKLGACSALINNHQLAEDIIKAAKKGVAGKIPISVKTRLGFAEVDMSWIEFLLGQGLDALIVHGRTAKQLSKGGSDWGLISQIRKLRDSISPKTVIIGNGDIKSRAQGETLAKQHKLDGIMIGRGVFFDPYIFSRQSPWPNLSPTAKMDIYAKHIELFVKTWGQTKNPAVLKKFAKVYINGFAGASTLRTKLMTCSSAEGLLGELVVDKDN